MTFTERALSLVSDQLITVTAVYLLCLFGSWGLTKFRMSYTQFLDVRGIVVDEPVLFRDKNNIRTFAAAACAFPYAGLFAVFVDGPLAVKVTVIICTVPFVGASSPILYKYLAVKHLWPLVRAFFSWARSKFETK